MSNQSIMVPLEGTAQNVDPSAWKIPMRYLRNGFATTAHHALLVLGVIAIGTLALMFIKPELADRLQEWSPFTVTADAENDNVAATGADLQQQRWVTQWLSRRYRVAYDATNMLVTASYSTARDMKLDPLLILAVMAIESGLNPFAESPVGAQGLMQVMSKVHHDKFQNLGGVKAALNPVANIKVGALILKDYMTRGGSVEAGLKMYVGAAAFDSDDGYGSRVLAEYRRLKAVASGKKVAAITTARAAPKPRPAETTTDNPLPAEAAIHTSELPKQRAAENNQIAAL